MTTLSRTSSETDKYMKSVYYAWKVETSIDLFKKMGVTLHPGAEKYYREAGLLK